MKKLLLVALVLLGICLPALTIADSVSAVDVLPPACKTDLCKDTQTGAADNPILGPKGIMTTITNLLSLAVGIVAIITILISGFMMTAAGGDATKTANARRALTYALIGLVIAATAQTIVIFILQKV